jgi:hypothetical protein
MRLTVRPLPTYDDWPPDAAFAFLAANLLMVVLLYELIWLTGHPPPARMTAPELAPETNSNYPQYRSQDENLHRDPIEEADHDWPLI